MLLPLRMRWLHLWWLRLWSRFSELIEDPVAYCLDAHAAKRGPARGAAPVPVSARAAHGSAARHPVGLAADRRHLHAVSEDLAGAPALRLEVRLAEPPARAAWGAARAAVLRRRGRRRRRLRCRLALEVRHDVLVELRTNLRARRLKVAAKHNGKLLAGHRGAILLG